MRFNWLLVAAAAFVSLAALPERASAQTLAYSAPGYTNLREGPSTRYRIIARVRGGSPVYVEGCLANWSWCYVTVADIEGWMAASRLLFTYAGRRVYVPDYYYYFGAPIITFDFGRYHRWRPHREYPWTGHPGGGGPGPDTLPPVEEREIPRGYTGHPGGGGPGPDTLPGPDDTGRTPRYIPPEETPGPDTGGGGQIECPLDNPNCY